MSRCRRARTSARADRKELIPFPATAPDLISNLIYVIEHDLVFHDDFYSDESLTRILGASHVNGERTSTTISLMVELRSMPTIVTDRGRALGGSALVRRDSSGSVSIQLQINDVASRPTYDVVGQILQQRWKPWSPNVPTPHARYVAPTGSHGNAQIVQHLGSALADNGIEADFDRDGNLYSFRVFFHPTIPGRD